MTAKITLVLLIVCLAVWLFFDWIIEALFEQYPEPLEPFVPPDDDGDQQRISE